MLVFVAFLAENFQVFELFTAERSIMPMVNFELKIIVSASFASITH